MADSLSKGVCSGGRRASPWTEMATTARKTDMTASERARARTKDEGRRARIKTRTVMRMRAKADDEDEDEDEDVDVISARPKSGGV